MKGAKWSYLWKKRNSSFPILATKLIPKKGKKELLATAFTLSVLDFPSPRNLLVTFYAVYQGNKKMLFLAADADEMSP